MIVYVHRLSIVTLLLFPHQLRHLSQWTAHSPEWRQSHSHLRRSSRHSTPARKVRISRSPPSQQRERRHQGVFLQQCRIMIALLHLGLRVVEQLRHQCANPPTRSTSLHQRMGSQEARGVRRKRTRRSNLKRASGRMCHGTSEV